MGTWAPPGEDGLSREAIASLISQTRSAHHTAYHGHAVSVSDRSQTRSGSYRGGEEKRGGRSGGELRAGVTSSPDRPGGALVGLGINHPDQDPRLLYAATYSIDSTMRRGHVRTAGPPCGAFTLVHVPCSGSRRR